MLYEFTLRTSGRTELVDITSQVESVVAQSGVKNGICVIYVPHTTAGVIINENADPSVKTDIKNHLEELVPWNKPYEHAEGNASAHIKSSIVGVSQTLIIENGKLVLGTWQGIFFCEFDGPRTRKVFVKIVSG
jgi:secondary thiamine-phosphate synthase enzyme